MTSPVIVSKPVVYAPIPDTFDQATQYVVQLAPVELDDHILVGVEIKDLKNTDTGDMLVTQGE